jgi:isopentenyl-diphosphate delta-isomerase
MDEHVILVDENDNVIGFQEKLQAHLKGNLHRAFSVFVFNKAGNLMLQKRARSKYHSGSLWSNTCCGHPRPGECTLEAAHRRLIEEMGFDCELHEVLRLTYKAEVDNNLREHEYDHVFVGEFQGEPNPSTEEVEEWRWMPIEVLKTDMQRSPERFTCWMIEIIKHAPMLAAASTVAGSYKVGHLTQQHGSVRETEFTAD